MASPPESWDGSYAANTPPPWDIGRPQPVFARLADEGLLSGRLLDAGCGTGENTLLAASKGADALGVDISPRAIQRARDKATDRGIAAHFEVADALNLGPLGVTFETVIDSGVFHVFDDDDRARYVASLASVLEPGGSLYLICFSELQPGDFGPRRVRQDELRAAFSDGWNVTEIVPEKFEANPDSGFGTTAVAAWLATIRRLLATPAEVSLGGRPPPSRPPAVAVLASIASMREGQGDLLWDAFALLMLASGRRSHPQGCLTTRMPVDGDYEPSKLGWVRDQVEAYEGSGGTEGTTLRDTGLPVVIITNLGGRSGKVRKTPVMRVEHDGRYAAVASRGGAPTHPQWYYNLRDNPRVELQDGTHRQDMTAREVTGAERAQWWERAVAAYPPYAEYQERTTRQIPVFVLEPA